MSEVTLYEASVQCLFEPGRVCTATINRPGRLSSRNVCVESTCFFFFFFTLVTGPRRSLSLKLSDTRVYGPQIRARLGTTAHFFEVVVLKLSVNMRLDSLGGPVLPSFRALSGRLKFTARRHRSNKNSLSWRCSSQGEFPA